LNAEPRFRYMQIELTDSCNQRCSFCYNVWKENGAYPRGRLGTDDMVRLVSKVIDETACDQISLTGGEPLLRKDVFRIAEAAAAKGVGVNIITKGMLLDDETVRRCRDAGVTGFEVSLHSHREEVHDELVGVRGALDKAVGALAAVANAGESAAAVFVATSSNVADLPSTVELLALLRARYLLFNRVACGGELLDGWAQAAPSPGQVREALEAALAVARRFRIGMGVGVQIPPCLVDLSGFEGLAVKFCPLNDPIKDWTYITIDPLGNLRMCNRSGFVLGNVLGERSVPELMKDARVAEFGRATPAFCRGCRYENECRGGCRADAYSARGRFDEVDPWVELWRSEAKKPAGATP